MLIKRLLAAVVLIPIVLLFIIYSSVNIFFLASGFIVLLMSLELSKLFGFEKKLTIIFSLIVTFIGSIVFYVFNNIYLNNIIFIISSLFLLYLFRIVYSYSQYSQSNQCVLSNQSTVYYQINSNKNFQVLLGMFLIIPFWLGLCFLKSNYSYMVLIIALLIVWSVDSGAYFAGKAYGKTKLIPEVSPGKTWEGLIGGLISLSVLSCIILMSSNISISSLDYCIVINIIMFNLILFVYSVFGDLTESMLKRIRNVKDSGNLIPGHGGVLDRLDSLIAIMPVYCLIIQYFN